MKRLIVLSMLAVVLVLSVSAVRAEEANPLTPIAPAAYGPAATGTIAYVVPDNTTGDQIWLAEPDGSNQRKIYTTGGADPYKVYGITSLNWRPDSGELAFASNHEMACSIYASDVYVIFPDGSGYRRVTNAPNCAALANYPQGSVTVSTGLTSGFYQIYVAGAPELKAPSLGSVTFDHVADLGNAQGVFAIQGKYRWFGDPVDVKANENVVHTSNFYGEGLSSIGAYGPVWRSDGSRIGYTFGCAALYDIADQPPVNTQGEQLFISDQANTCAMEWGPTAATASDILYYTTLGDKGIYRTTEHSTSPGEKVVGVAAVLLDMHYLPNGSGLLATATNAWGDSANMYRVDFDPANVTQLTNYTDKFVRNFAISPDGLKVIFELAPRDWSTLSGGASDLWIMDIDDASTAQPFQSGAAHPSWSLKTPYVPAPGAPNPPGAPVPPSAPNPPGAPVPPSAPVPPGTSKPTFKLYLPLLVR